MYIYMYTYMCIFVEASVDVGCAAVEIGVLQCVAVFCIVLHWCFELELKRPSRLCSMMQCDAVCCRVV